jgi:uncharacterized protein
MQLRPNLKTYPTGVPCWVELLAPNPRAMTVFYRGLFGWEAEGPGRMPGGGDYFVEHLEGKEVAGIATLPPTAEPAWTTYICVDDLEHTVGRAVGAGGTVIVEALDAPPAGRLAIVTDPSGASFGLWKPGQRAGAQRINEPSTWSMSSLRTGELDRSSAFYAAVFGWVAEPYEAGPSRTALFRLPGYMGGRPQQPVPRDVVAAAFEDPGITQAHWSVDFWIDDADAAAARVAQLGGKVLVAPRDEGPFRRFVLADANGALSTIRPLVPQGFA